MHLVSNKQPNIETLNQMIEIMTETLTKLSTKKCDASYAQLASVALEKINILKDRV